MAIIERVTLLANEPSTTSGEDHGLSALGLPGLRIATRATTSSLSDYVQWNVDSLRDRDAIITDGTCS